MPAVAVRGTCFRPSVPPSLKAVNMVSGRRKVRLFLLAGTLLSAAPALPGSVPRVLPAAQPTDSVVRNDALRPPEVRLRKLHLVRPDLIPYPIEYEVVC